MGRKERRELERKLRHINNTKPWQLKTLVQEQYGRDLVEARINNEDVLSPGDKVMLDIKKISLDPDFAALKQEYKDFIFENANKVFTLRQEAKQSGPFGLVSFCEDEEEPRKWFFVGYVEKVKGGD
jgi:hypothetical protein